MKGFVERSVFKIQKKLKEHSHSLKIFPAEKKYILSKLRAMAGLYYSSRACGEFYKEEHSFLHNKELFANVKLLVDSGNVFAVTDNFNNHEKYLNRVRGSSGVNNVVFDSSNISEYDSLEFSRCFPWMDHVVVMWTARDRGNNGKWTYHSKELSKDRLIQLKFGVPWDC